MKIQKTQRKRSSFLKKVGRIGVLLAIKESYLLSKNILGLGVHPFKTLRAMFREKDRSQQVLVLGLPVYLFVGGVLGIVVARMLIGAPDEWGVVARVLGIGVLVVSGGVGGYLVYWLTKVWRIRWE